MDNSRIEFWAQSLNLFGLNFWPHTILILSGLMLYINQNLFFAYFCCTKIIYYMQAYLHTDISNYELLLLILLSSAVMILRLFIHLDKCSVRLYNNFGPAFLVWTEKTHKTDLLYKLYNRTEQLSNLYNPPTLTRRLLGEL